MSVKTLVRRVATEAARSVKETWVEVGREGVLGDAWIDRDLRRLREAQAAEFHATQVTTALEKRLVKEENAGKAQALLASIQEMRDRGASLRETRARIEEAAAPALAASAQRVAGERAAISGKPRISRAATDEPSSGKPAAAEATVNEPAGDKPAADEPTVSEPPSSEATRQPPAPEPPAPEPPAPEPATPKQPPRPAKTSEIFQAGELS